MPSRCSGGGGIRGRSAGKSIREREAEVCCSPTRCRSRVAGGCGRDLAPCRVDCRSLFREKRLPSSVARTSLCSRRSSILRWKTTRVTAHALTPFYQRGKIELAWPEENVRDDPRIIQTLIARRPYFGGGTQ